MGCEETAVRSYRRDLTPARAGKPDTQACTGALGVAGSVLVEQEIERSVDHTAGGALESVDRGVLELGAPAHQQWRHQTHNRQRANSVDPASDLLVVVLHCNLLRLSQSPPLWHVPCSRDYEEPARFRGLRQHMAYHLGEQSHELPGRGARVLPAVGRSRVSMYTDG